MKLYRIASIFVLLAITSIAAQQPPPTTVVTATIQDSTPTTYANCQWSVIFVPQGPPGAGPYSPDALLQGQQGTCDAFGKFTVNLADNINTVSPGPSKWAFSICSAVGYLAGPYCKNNILITITGVTQDISSIVDPLMPLLPIVGGVSGLHDPGSSGIVKRTTLNVTVPTIASDVVGLFGSCSGTQYLGADGACHTSSSLPTGVAAGSVCASNGIGVPCVYQLKPVIEARDISGVDCTGATDSSTALNTLTVIDGITGKTLSFKNCPSIRLTSQWLIKGQQFTEVDFGGTFGQGGQSGSPIQGGTRVFGCGGTADGLIRIDDTGFSYFHGGTFAAKGDGCASSFIGDIRVTNSASGGYTPSRNTFSSMDMYSAYNAVSPPANFYGLKIDGGPNQEGYAIHHVQVYCQQATGSIGIWVNDLTADSTDIDEESHITTCYRGIEVDQGTVRVSHSHIGGNGSFSQFGSGGANFFEGSTGNGCFAEISYVIAAETSGAFLGDSATSGAQACWRSIHNNQIGFPQIDSAVYPINAMGGAYLMWGNDFGNGGIAVAIHNNTLLGDDTNGTNGPAASVYDLGGNQLSDSGNVGSFLLTYQAFARNMTFLGPTGPVANSAPAAGTSSDWALLPNGGASGGSVSYPSSRLIFVRSLSNATPAFDQFAFKSVGKVTDSSSTLALTYKTPNGFTITPTLGIQPSVSGLTFSQVTAPAFSGVGSSVTNVGTAGSTTYTYVLVAEGGCGHSAASTTGTTNLGNASPNGTNHPQVHIDPTGGAWGIDVYRTVGGATQGKIGTALATDQGGGGTSFLTFDDTGLAGDGNTAPVTNTSGCLIIPGASAGSYVKADGTGFGTPSGGTPGGSTTQIQYNDGGSFAGDAFHVWNKATGSTVQLPARSLTIGPTTNVNYYGTIQSPALIYSENTNTDTVGGSSGPFTLPYNFSTYLGQPSVDSAVEDFNVNANIAILPASTHNYTSELAGLHAECDHNGSGTVADCIGAASEAYNLGNGTVSIMSGSTSDTGTLNPGNTGAITTLNGYWPILYNKGGGTVSNAYAIHIGSPSGNIGVFSTYAALQIDSVGLDVTHNPNPLAISVTDGNSNLGTGTVTVTNLTSTGAIRTPSGSTGALPIRIGGGTNGFYSGGTNVITTVSGVDVLTSDLAFGTTSVDGSGIGFSNGAAAARDLSLTRDAAGVLDVGTGALGSKAGTIKTANIILTGTLTGPNGIYSGQYSCVNVTPVTVSANVATDQLLMACTIPGGALNSLNRVLRIKADGIYSTPALSTSQMTMSAKLCTVSGCGSGTVITLAAIQSGALGSLAVTNNAIQLSLNSGTQTAGASSKYEAHGSLLIDLGAATTAADSVYADTNTAVSSAIDSTVQLFLQITGAFSSASASNSMTERMLTVDSVN